MKKHPLGLGLALIIGLLWNQSFAYMGQVAQQLQLVAAPTTTVIDLTAHNAPHLPVEIVFSISNPNSVGITLEIDPNNLATVSINQKTISATVQNFALQNGGKQVLEIAAGESVEIVAYVILRATEILEKNQSYTFHATLHAINLTKKNVNTELSANFMLSTE